MKKIFLLLIILSLILGCTTTGKVVQETNGVKYTEEGVKDFAIVFDKIKQEKVGTCQIVEGKIDKTTCVYDQGVKMFIDYERQVELYPSKEIHLKFKD